MNTLASALVNGAVLSAVLTAAVWLFLRLAPRRFLNAATRHMIWWMVLAITMVLPALQFPIHLPRPAKPIQAELPAAYGTLTIPRISSRMEQVIRPIPPFTPLELPPSSRPTLSFPIRVTAGAWLKPILWIWLFAGTLLLLRLVADYAALHRRKTFAKDVPPQLQARAANWLELCGARRRNVRLAASAEIDIPVAVGPRSPAILIPARLLEAIEEGALDQIGLHEAAHIARYDDYALLLQRVIEALFALHPVVRWTTRQIDLEREIACDDFVVQATRRARSYASCLTQMVELCGIVRPALVAAPVADDLSHLTRRVEMLLDTTRRTGTRLLKARLSAVIAIVAALAWLAVKTPQLVAFAKPIVEHAAKQVASQLPALMMPQVAARQQDQAKELEGTVVEDSSGDPLASAELRFHGAGMRELAADLDTDREGRFRAPGLPPGDYSVDVSKPNYITTAFRLHVPGTDPTVRLVRYGVIDGQATDSEGRPIPGQILDGGRTIGSARISILVKQPGSQELQLFRETPLQDGRYRIYDLPPGEYAVGFWYSGVKDGSGLQLYPNNAQPRFFSVAGGEEYNDINFSVAPSAAYRVSGKIELPKSGGIFAVTLGLPDQPVLPLARTLAVEDGSFQFEKVPLGSYDLFVAGPVNGYTEFESTLGGGSPLFGRTRIQVAGQNVEGLNVSVSAARSFHVVLRSNNSTSPTAGCPQSATISLASLEPWGIWFGVSAQASFAKEQTIADLPPGRFRVVAKELGSGCYQLNPPVVDLSGDVSNPVVVELASAGSVYGVLRTSPARPADFAVVLLDAENTAGAQAQVAFPDAEGRFKFEGLRPGRYRIAAPPAIEKSSGRWVADLAHMLEVNVPGGKATDVELAASLPPGGHP
jgi:beta-lactamase regulating signal transducer with metallopeptidase domain